MRKLIAFIIAVSMVFMFTACSGGSADGDLNDDAQAVEEEEDTSAPDRELAKGDYAEIGEGSFRLTNESATEDDDSEVVIQPDMNGSPYAYIDYELKDMEGNLLTYIFIDGISMDEQQVDGSHRGSIGLGEDEPWALTEETHKVEAVQFADDDPEGKMVFYRSATYTVKGSK